MLTQFTPLPKVAARLIVEADDDTDLPPPPSEDVDSLLDDVEDPLLSLEGARESVWRTEFRRNAAWTAATQNVSMTPVDDEDDDEDDDEEDEDPIPEDGGAWTLRADVDDFMPQPIGPVMGGRYLGLRATASGEACSVLVGESGEVWEWRKHWLHPRTPPANMVGHPVRLPSLCGKHVTQIACGAHHTIALSANSEVWVWGRGDRGQLGLGDFSGRAQPTRLASLQNAAINSVGCGAHHSLCCSSSRAQPEGSRCRGAVWAWGCNSFGQLGLGGTVLGFGGRPPGAAVAIGLHKPSDAADVSSNDNGSGTNDIVSTVDNDDDDDDAPAVALAASPQRVVDLCGSGVLCVSGGDRHSVALLACDEVWAWGANDFGQLGSPLGLALKSNEGASSPSPVSSVPQQALPPPATPTLAATNSVWTRPRCIEAMSGESTVAIACGSLHAVALTDSGDVYAWGRVDAFARLNGEVAPREPSSTTPPPPLAPIQLPSSTGCAESDCCVTAPSLLHTSKRANDENSYGSSIDRNGAEGGRGERKGLPPPPTLSGNTVVQVSCSALDTYLATRAGELLIFKGNTPLPPAFSRLPSIRAAATAAAVAASSFVHAQNGTTAAASPLLGASDPRSPRLGGGGLSGSSSSNGSVPQSLPPLPPPGLEPTSAASAAAAAADHRQPNGAEVDHDESLLSHLRHAIIDPTDDGARRALAYNIMEPREGFAADEQHSTTTTRLGAIDAAAHANEAEDIASDADALAARTLALAVVAVKQHALSFRRFHPGASVKEWVKALLAPRAAGTPAAATHVPASNAPATTATTRGRGGANQAGEVLPPMRAPLDEGEDPFMWLDPELEAQAAWESAAAVVAPAAAAATGQEGDTKGQGGAKTRTLNLKEGGCPQPDVHGSSDLLGGLAHTEIARRAANGSATNRRRCRQRALGLSLATGSSSSPQMMAFLGTPPVRVRSGLSRDFAYSARLAAAAASTGSGGAEGSSSYSVAAPSGHRGSDSSGDVWTRFDVKFEPGGREGLLDLPMHDNDDDENEDDGQLYSGSRGMVGAGLLEVGDDHSIGAELALLSARLPGLAAMAKRQQEQQPEHVDADHHNNSSDSKSSEGGHHMLPRVTVPGVGPIALEKLLLWATTGFIAVQNSKDSLGNQQRQDRQSGRSACMHLLELAAAAQRFGGNNSNNGCASSRIVWRCAHELAHCLRAWDPGAVGTVEMVLDLLVGARAHNLAMIERVVLRFAATHYPLLVVRHAPLVVKRLTKPPSPAHLSSRGGDGNGSNSSSDSSASFVAQTCARAAVQNPALLAILLQLSEPGLVRAALESLPRLHGCPPDALDVSGLKLFRCTQAYTSVEAAKRALERQTKAAAAACLPRSKRQHLPRGPLRRAAVASELASVALGPFPEPPPPTPGFDQSPATSTATAATTTAHAAAAASSRTLAPGQADQNGDEFPASAPNVLIETSNGLWFTAHATVLAARSCFFEKVLLYHRSSRAPPTEQAKAEDGASTATTTEAEGVTAGAETVPPPPSAPLRIFLQEDAFLNPAPPSAAAFKVFLKFLYTGSVAVPLDPTHALYLLRVLDYFDLRCRRDADRLATACHAAISTKVDDASALPLLRAAHALGLDEVRDLAFKHVLAHPNACLADPRDALAMNAAAASAGVHSAMGISSLPPPPLPPPDDDDDGEGGDDSSVERSSRSMSDTPSREASLDRPNKADGMDESVGFGDVEPADELEELCADMPELAAALIRALIQDKEQRRVDAKRI